MQIHRSRHARGFTVLPNTLLQDRRLSYTARGLLADLLSRPDGWSEDGRRMADTSPQGRLTVAKALRELAAAGYYRVDKVRRPDGTFVSESHVYDSPQTGPSAVRPGSGRRATDDHDAHPVKDRGKEPSLPAQRSHSAEAFGGRCDAREAGQAKLPASDGVADGPIGEAAAVLFRVLRPEPRLRLGTAEAIALAPLVGIWLERGYGQRDLAEALLPGLPARLHSAAALVRDRLTRKLPPAPEPSTPAKPSWCECGSCSRPIPHEGICRSCAGLADRTDDTAARSDVAARGRARVRAALQTDAGRLLPARS